MNAQFTTLIGLIPNPHSSEREHMLSRLTRVFFFLSPADHRKFLWRASILLVAAAGILKQLRKCLVMPDVTDLI
jgi:hypothetical protein